MCFNFIWKENETQDISGRLIIKALTYKKALECIKDNKTDYNGYARIIFKDGIIKYYKNYGEEYNNTWY